MAKKTKTASMLKVDLYDLRKLAIAVGFKAANAWDATRMKEWVVTLPDFADEDTDAGEQQELLVSILEALEQKNVVEIDESAKPKGKKADAPAPKAKKKSEPEPEEDEDEGDAEEDEDSDDEEDESPDTESDDEDTDDDESEEESEKEDEDEEKPVKKKSVKDAVKEEKVPKKKAVAPKVEKKASTGKTDRFGAKEGTQSSAINMAMTIKPKTVKELCDETGLPSQRVRSHMTWLLEHEYIEHVEGKGYKLISKDIAKPAKEEKAKKVKAVEVEEDEDEEVEEASAPKKAKKVKAVEVEEDEDEEVEDEMEDEEVEETPKKKKKAK